MSESTDEIPADLTQYFQRVNELKAQGVDWIQASGIAGLEMRIEQWPSGWGDNLHILIYGDFKPPNEDLFFPELGITLYHEERKNTVIRSAMCVLEAVVTIQGKNVSSLIDASRRINTLLGIWVLVEWGRGPIGWWSWVTHNFTGGAVSNFKLESIETAIKGILSLPPQMKKKVDAALYWVREPRNLILNSYRSDLLRVYSAYWNAFECLVEAINLISPRSSLSRTEKQRAIDDFVSKRGGKLTSRDIQECYQTIVNPSLVGKASHALQVCFGSEAEVYIEECFKLSNANDRLYDVRNAINHGEIDAENPEELARIQARLDRLWMIVWGMFGRIIPFPAPVDLSLQKDKENIENQT